MSLLVKNGDIDLDAVDVSKSTALHYAAKCGKEEAMRLLLEAGAMITPVNAAGQQPVDVAVDAANQLVASLLRVGARRGRQFVAPDLSDKPWARHVMFALPLVLLTSVSSTLARYGWFAWQTACCFLLVVVGLARVQKVCVRCHRNTAQRLLRCLCCVCSTCGPSVRRAPVFLLAYVGQLLPIGLSCIGFYTYQLCQIIW